MEKQHRDEVIHMYESMEEAMHIIGEVISNTKSVPLPPPVNDDWLETVSFLIHSPRFSYARYHSVARSFCFQTRPSLMCIK